MMYKYSANDEPLEQTTQPAAYPSLGERIADAAARADAARPKDLPSEPDPVREIERTR